jgi:hypothetical protein
MCVYIPNSIYFLPFFVIHSNVGMENTLPFFKVVLLDHYVVCLFQYLNQLTKLTKLNATGEDPSTIFF